MLSLGFASLEDIGPTEMAERFFSLPEGAPDRGAGSHVHIRWEIKHSLTRRTAAFELISAVEDDPPIKPLQSHK
ncbi:hypothetical protein [Rhizobium leguminosarum]|uniref:hypothetical protein n=1 Tax=Rhizobium leguminosarum TaxID=384 RepID=UPI001FE1A32A|nr:hypothetical protein [Rhizobium leguminosarum]